MKVAQNNTPIQLDAYVRQIQQQRSQQVEVEKSNAAQQGRSDTVQLSAEAKKVQQAAAQAQVEQSEARDEKVRQVKMDIEKGTYKVDSAQVATDMLRETFENNKVFGKIDTRA